MTSPFHSIRWRLQGWHGLILLGVIVAFCLTAYQLAKGNQDRRIDRDIRQLERRLVRGLMASYLAEEGPESNFTPSELLARLRAGSIALPPETMASFQGTESGYAYFVVFGPEGEELLRSPNAPGDVAMWSQTSEGPGEHARTLGNRRERVGGPSRGARSVVGRDISPEVADMRGFTLSLVLSGAGVWLLGLLGGWWLAGRAIKPIASISATATRIAEGNLADRIDTAGAATELDQLAEVLNQTFERLHAAFERQRRFTADASHELRTPVTILLAETDRILRRQRSAEEYREALQTCQESARRMGELIEALLLLSKQENAPERRDACDLAAIARDSAAQLAPLATERDIAVEAELQEAPCQADPIGLSILASNLLANAIQHNRHGGRVRLRTLVENGLATLTVSDDGPGIDPEDLPHIFDRFYRANKARTGASGHTGLGLAIARAIAEKHGARLEARSDPNQGATFTFSLSASAGSAS